MIDTHTHLYLPEFAEDQDEVIARAVDAGVQHVILPNVGLDTVAPMIALAQRYPSLMSMAMGLHPTEVSDNWREALAVLMAELDRGKYVAVGEIGMDLYWDKTYRSEQMQVFDQQLSVASKHKLPVIIHCREALDETLEVLQGHKDVPAVFHSFGGSVEDVERIRAVGDYYFGINGVVTFKNCHVRDTLPTIGINRLLLETDAPYLAPVPKRGKRNESSYIAYTAAHMVQSLNIPLPTLIAATTANALRLFRLTPN